MPIFKGTGPSPEQTERTAAVKAEAHAILEKYSDAIDAALVASAKALWDALKDISATDLPPGQALEEMPNKAEQVTLVGRTATLQLIAMVKADVYRKLAGELLMSGQTEFANQYIRTASTLDNLVQGQLALVASQRGKPNAETNKDQ